MKAAWYEKSGDARSVLQFGEMDQPAPEAGEVLVRLHASGVNPVDVKARKGWPVRVPRIIPHSDGAGIVEAVGKGVPNARVGERVWIWNGQWKRPFGTAAEYIALPAGQAMRLPEQVTFVAGACLGIPALTAIHAVRSLGEVGGKTVLVTGAASSVGYYAAQLLKIRGARVIGTASTARQAHAREAGADFVVDYRAKDVAAVVKDLTRGAGVNGIVDIDVSSTVRLLADGIMAPHGRHVVYGSNSPADVPLPFSPMLQGNLSIAFMLVFELTEAERAAALGELQTLLQENRLRHAIGARFPLSAIIDAHEAVDAGHTVGNVVLEM